MKYVPNAVSRAVGLTALKLSKNSPHILFGVGVVGMVGTAVLASRATLKLDAVLQDSEKANFDLEAGYASLPEHVRETEYSEGDYAADKRTLRIRTAVEVAKLYAPAVGVGVVSVLCLTKSHQILTSRNAALTAAYTAVSEAMKQYRKRVVEELGEDKDREFRYGKATSDVTVDGPKGVKTTKRQHIGGVSQFARFFDEDNRNWGTNPESNLTWLRAHQEFLNKRLEMVGWLSLNDAYDAIGLERSQAGQVMGWMWNRGDTYIDFGIWSDEPRKQEAVHDYLIGASGAIVVDFNCEPIYDYIDHPPGTVKTLKKLVGK